MNPILTQYFDRIKSIACKNQIEYHCYTRESGSVMPFSIHLRFLDQNGIQRNSWGSGKSNDEAFGKALMEMIERVYFTGVTPFEFKNLFGLFKKKKTLFELSQKYAIPLRFFHPSNTNGVAIHLTENKAIKSAMLELIERHTILYALVAGIGPESKIDKVITQSKTCRFYIWRGPLNTYVVVGALTDDVGSYFSSACDFRLDGALLKAELELNSFIFLKDNIVDDFKVMKEDIQSINRYHRYSGDKSAIEFFENKSPGKVPDLNKERFYFTRIPVPEMFTGLYPLPCVRVIHPDIQQLFFDNWQNDYLNPRIFEAEQKLPSFPHIIA